MTRIFLALVALVGLMWLASWLGKASPAQRGRALKLIVLYGIAGALLLLVVTGRIPVSYTHLTLPTKRIV